MAKAVVKQYGRNKAGKLSVKNKTVVKGKDARVNDALAAQGMNKSMTKGQLKALEQNQKHTENMADIARKAANFQSAATQVGLTAQAAMKNFGPSTYGQTGTAKTAVSGVQDLIDGGAESAGNSRDDDDQGGFVG